MNLKLRIFIAIVVLIFIGSVIIGAILPKDLKSSVISTVQEYMEEYIGENRTIPELYLLILINNLRSLGIAIAIPFIGQTLVPVVNGLIMGILFSIPITEVNPQIHDICKNLTPVQDLTLKLVLTLPHGVIELSGILLGCAVAFYFWLLFILWLIRKSIDLKRLIIRFLTIISISVMLLVIAALVEIIITPLIALVTQSYICR